MNRKTTPNTFNTFGENHFYELSNSRISRSPHPWRGAARTLGGGSCPMVLKEVWHFAVSGAEAALSLIQNSLGQAKQKRRDGELEDDSAARPPKRARFDTAQTRVVEHHTPHHGNVAPTPFQPRPQHFSYPNTEYRANGTNASFAFSSESSFTATPRLAPFSTSKGISTPWGYKTPAATAINFNQPRPTAPHTPAPASLESAPQARDTDWHHRGRAATLIGGIECPQPRATDWHRRAAPRDTAQRVSIPWYLLTPEQRRAAMAEQRSAEQAQAPDHGARLAGARPTGADGDESGEVSVVGEENLLGSPRGAAEQERERAELLRAKERRAEENRAAAEEERRAAAEVRSTCLREPRNHQGGLPRDRPGGLGACARRPCTSRPRAGTTPSAFCKHRGGAGEGARAQVRRGERGVAAPAARGG
jgi:hypothetical protein